MSDPSQQELKECIYAFLMTQDDVVSTATLMRQPKIGSAGQQAVQDSLQKLTDEGLVLPTVLGYVAELKVRDKPKHNSKSETNKLWKLVPVSLVVWPLVALYTTFVLQHLWNWFATKALNLPEIPYWVMYGLTLLIGMFTTNDNVDQEYTFKVLTIAIDACVPEDKREWVNEQIEEHKEGLWLNVFLKVFGKIVGMTITLLIGWTVHAFLV